MTTDNSTAPVQGLTDEQITDIAERAHKSGDLVWAGFCRDSSGKYERPVISQSVLKLVRLVIAAAPHTATPVVQPVVPAGWRLVPENTSSKSDTQIAAELQRNMDALLEPDDPDDRIKYRTLIRIMARARNRLEQIAAAPASDADSMQGSQPTKEV